MISFACPACQKAYKVADEMAGKKAKCKQCGQVMMIPPPVVEAQIVEEEIVEAEVVVAPLATGDGGQASPAADSASTVSRRASNNSVSGRATMKPVS